MPFEEIKKEIDGYARLQDLATRDITVHLPIARTSSTQKRQLSEGDSTSETPSVSSTTFDENTSKVG